MLALTLNPPVAVNPSGNSCQEQIADGLKARSLDEAWQENPGSWSDLVAATRRGTTLSTLLPLYGYESLLARDNHLSSNANLI